MTARLVHQGLRHQHAPLHAARELAHVGIGFVGTNPGSSNSSSIQAALSSNAKVTRLKLQSLTHGKEGVKDQLLRHHTQHAACLNIVGLHIVAMDQTRGLVWLC
jgi:hypothetical protein